MLAQPEAGSFRFARRRLTGFTAAILGYEYLASDDLSSWDPVSVTEESATPLAARPGYEVVTLSLSPLELMNKERLFLKIVAEP